MKQENKLSRNERNILANYLEGINEHQIYTVIKSFYTRNKSDTSEALLMFITSDHLNSEEKAYINNELKIYKNNY